MVTYSFDQFNAELEILQSRFSELEIKREDCRSNPLLLREYSVWGSFKKEFQENEKVVAGLILEFDILFDTTNSLPGLFFRAFDQGQQLSEVDSVFNHHRVRVDLKAHPVRKFHPQVFYLHECQLNEILSGMENKLEGWFSTVMGEVFGIYINI